MGNDYKRYLNIGRAEDNKNLALEKDEYKYLINFIKEKRKELKFDVTYGCSHFLGLDFEKKQERICFFCVAGYTTASILYNGDIYVCPDVERRKELVQEMLRLMILPKCGKIDLSGLEI